MVVSARCTMERGGQISAWFADIFDSQSFLPHGHCYLWRPDILWLNVGSDLLIALAYYSIPVSLIYFVRKRKDLAFHWVSVLLGGDVVLTETSFGHGCTFTITIDSGPIEKILFQNYDDKGKVSSQESSVPPSDIHFEGIRVLLVDDAPDNQVLVGRLLKLAGAVVDVAENGEEALDKARRNGYDMVLMDLRMPIMDGYEATAKLREGGYQAPIIALTAHALKEERQRCLDHGFNDHLSKPIDRRSLLERIVLYSRRA